ncbi:putative citrate synthase [Xylogone sp. PMI_703]|nr:putative citrate synthase [Xylogone sp. PMI_703]
MSDGTLLVQDSRTSKQYTIPITADTVSATDFQKITSPTGKLALYDPGLQNTIIKKTQVTGRDPVSGITLFRGFLANQIWGRDADFEDHFHLLVFGKDPFPEEREKLRRRLANAMTNVPETVVKVIQAFPRTSHPLPMIVAGLAAFLSANPSSLPVIHGDNIYHGNSALCDEGVIQATAAFAVVMGLINSHRKQLPYIPADPKKSFYQNVFTMMRCPVDHNYLVTFREGMVLNSDNGMTQSTVVMLSTASSLPDPISCLISAITAAYGPLHYGAQEAGAITLKSIGSVDKVPLFLEQVKRRERRLFGFGHRLHKREDPRLASVKRWLKMMDFTPEKEPMLGLAQEIDRLASSDEYFIKRNLRANADFYTHFLFKAWGFDWDMICAANMFHRIIGLMAHWREAMDQPIKIFRATDLYVGPGLAQEDSRTGDAETKIQARL